MLFHYLIVTKRLLWSKLVSKTHIKFFNTICNALEKNKFLTTHNIINIITTYIIFLIYIYIFTLIFIVTTDVTLLYGGCDKLMTRSYQETFFFGGESAA